MIIFNNRYASVVHRIDPRFRIAASAAFAVVIILTHKVPVLLAAVAVSVSLAALARLPARSVLRRLGQLNVFMVFLFALLPLFVPGEPAVSIGRLSWSREGLLRALLITLRANAIMTALVALLSTMEPAHLAFALHKLGCPEKLTHVLLFMVRYVEVIHREYHRLTDAMKLRAFRVRLDRHTLRALGYLVGQLLLRSLERSERILQAMKCRGFRGRFYVMERFRVSGRDFAFAVAAAGLVALLSWMEWG